MFPKYFYITFCRTLGNAMSTEEVTIFDIFTNKDGNVKYEDLLNEIVFL